MAASILVLLTGLLIYDRLVHRYDDAIETLTTEVASNEQLLERGQSMQDVYQHLAERRNLQRDWLADLDAICRELEQEDAVRLTTIRGETALDQRPAVLRFSGVAPDSTTVTRMIERYASDANNIDVTPLGLRPYLNDGISGVQFDLQLKRTQPRSEETRP
jgi:Tfp pilus assembly protein PilN